MSICLPLDNRLTKCNNLIMNFGPAFNLIEKRSTITIAFIFQFLIGLSILLVLARNGYLIITRCQTPVKLIDPLPTVIATPSAVLAIRVLYGKASYYSRAGCLGCRADLLMANGQVLDDTKLTVAFNRSKLNTTIVITNQKNGKVVRARVTDTGGFERHGKIVDLSVATKNALGCGDVCNVKIEL